MMLYDDYGRISGSRHYLSETERLKKISQHTNRIARLKIAIYTGDEKLMRKLTGSPSVNVAEGTLKIWLSERGGLMPEYTGKPGGEGFESVLAETSKYMGFRIDARKVTVAEFAAMIRSFGREIEREKKATNRLPQ